MLTQLLITVVFAIFLYFKVFKNKKYEFNKNGSIKRNKSRLRIIASTVYTFIFHTKEEDRLEYFKLIHKFSPRYMRLKFWKFDYICVYDPELLKKIFNSQLACQRPFRNCFQLEKGLLASECKFFILIIFRFINIYLFNLDEYWRVSRKHLNIAFNLNVLKGFIPIFSEYAGDVVKDMAKHLDGKEFDLLYPLAQLTARSVAGRHLSIIFLNLCVMISIFSNYIERSWS